MSLPATEVSGKYFHIEDPVHSDGLMHRYVLESRWGTFRAYGQDQLKVRLQEIGALTTIADTSDEEVVMRSVLRGTQDQARTMAHVATHPIGTLTGVPKGIAHLFSGYRAEAEEVTAQVDHTLSRDAPTGAPAGKQNTLGNVGNAAGQAARSQADHYIGLSAAERRWYAKLGVDPYNNNAALRQAVTRLSRIDAAASLGMRFAPVGIPFAGEVQRAVDAIEHEDPAVLRKRRHEMLIREGLTAGEIERFEHTPLLTPTRQTALADAVHELEGVEGRAELLRHAMTVESEEETEIFLQSTLLLLHFHSHHPVTRIVAGLRIPAAELADGHVVLFGAFDAIQWTEQVAGYEQTLREALPHAALREIWTTGSVSPAAREALELRGWVVHAQADVALAQERASGQP
jgi:hypothetical protein